MFTAPSGSMSAWLRRSGVLLAMVATSLVILAACSTEPESPAVPHQSETPSVSDQAPGEVGLTREEAERLGVDAAPGDALIIGIYAFAGSDKMTVSVMNISDTEDDYTVVVSSNSKVLGTNAQAIGARETVFVVIALDSTLVSGSMLDVRLDGTMIGEGVGSSEAEVR